MAKRQARQGSKAVTAPARKTRAPDPAVDVQPADELNKTEQVEGLAVPGEASLASPDGFPFSAKQLEYLLALRDAALEGRPTSDSAISEATGISRTTIWTWKHDPAFSTWVRDEIKGDHDVKFELAVARHTNLAIKGSVRSFEAVARLRSIGARGGGFTDPGDVVDNSIANYSVNLLCPRPPALGETS